MLNFALMIMITNKHIPFKGFCAMTLYPFVFVRRATKLDAVGQNHELIHCEQQKEMMWIGFFVWYCIEWMVLLLLYRNPRKAYCNISFEQEAYKNETNMEYLKHRKRFAWIRKTVPLT